MANIAQLLTEHMDIWAAAETEKKAGRGRASGSAGTVYGVKKLRELILELAVRGKLVPQDPNDEPASELLKRIQAEKAKLIAEGKLKKEKPLAVIAEDEKYFNAPESWDWIRLGELALQLNDGNYGESYPKANELVSSGIPFLTSASILPSGEVDRLGLKYITDEKHSELTKAQIEPGDVIFPNRGARGGQLSGSEPLAIIVPSWIVTGNVNPQLTRVKLLKDSFLPEYLCINLNSNFFLNQIRDATGGTALSFINLTKTANFIIGVPPLSEQHRIVAKVDELMALCDQLEQQHSNAQEAHETLVSQLLATLTRSQNAAEFNANWQRIYAHFDVLFTTEASIDVLKKNLLQLAVMGKLVLQDPNDEPASALLKRIQAEKAKLITEGKLKKDKPLASIGENEKPFELPKGWEWTTLLNAAVVNPRNNAPDDIEASFVPMTYIGSEFSDKHQDEKRLWKDIKQGFTHFSEGDIGVAKITPCFENSKACVFENLENGLGAGTTELHIVRPVMNTLSPRYVLAYLKSPRFLELGESKMTGTAGQKRLPKDFVETNPFPLPPLAEQHRIVAKVDALMALCDQLKSRIKQANQQQQTIADVLVAQTVA